MSDTDVPLSELRDIGAFPIARGWVCEHCVVVCNQPRCPYCLGESLSSLNALLNRESPDAGKEEV